MDSSGAAKHGAAAQRWARKKEPSSGKFEHRLLRKEGSDLKWYSDEKGTQPKGNLKLGSILDVDVEGDKVVVGTATKTHEFQFDSEAEANAWAEEIQK